MASSAAPSSQAKATRGTKAPAGPSSSYTTHAPAHDGAAPAKKNPKEMTKAERRELQERQRAAKAATAGPKGQGKPGGKDGTQQGKKASGAESSKGAYSAHSTPVNVGKDAAQAHAHALAAQQALAQQQTRDTQGRGLRIFSHFGLTKPPANAKGASQQIHPAVVRLGLQFAAFKIVGANARCIATLTAFKSVIQDYTTPPHTTLARHLMTHLSPQISHLVSARPMGVSMGNAIRQLKLEISGVDIDLPEQDAKDFLCSQIDTYIREHIVIADQVIADSAVQKIKDGDVVLTYARSSVVEKVILCAHAEGKRISVIIADSRPLLEGKALLKVLTAAGLPCTYLLLPALGAVLSSLSSSLSSPTSNLPSTAAQPPASSPSTPHDASTISLYVAAPAPSHPITTPSPSPSANATPTPTSPSPAPTHAAPPPSGSILALLGAAALHADGGVTARAGTALVALLARARGVPVLVCCETCKFSGGVLLDGFAKNELVPPSVLAPLPPSIPRDALVLPGESASPVPNLEILNPLYDLTPARDVTAVVTEVGIVPPSSVGAIQSQIGSGFS